MKVIKFYAEWCGPCKVLERKLEEKGIEHESVNVDSDYGNEMSTKYGVRGLPVVIVVNDNDVEIGRFPGVSINELVKFCDRMGIAHA